MNIHAYIYLPRTAALMTSLGIGIRDTFLPDVNLDDFFSNGNQYGGPRLLDVSWDGSSEYSNVSGHKRYSIPGYASVAYDGYRISIPERLRHRDNPIVHELVHFLQTMTNAEDAAYIPFDGSNQMAYFGQRCEIEAFVTQIAYILYECHSYRDSNLSSERRAEISSLVAN